MRVRHSANMSNSSRLKEPLKVFKNMPQSKNRKPLWSYICEMDLRNGAAGQTSKLFSGVLAYYRKQMPCSTMGHELLGLCIFRHNHTFRTLKTNL